MNGGSMIFLQRPVNVLHLEIIPQAAAISLQPGRCSVAFSVERFLLSAQQSHLGWPPPRLGGHILLCF